MIAADMPPMLAAQETAIDTLARTLWGEACSESVRSKEALAAVVVNRVANAREQVGCEWWGGTVVEVCLAGDLFACWHRSPQARGTLMQVCETDPVFAVCRRIAARAVRGALVDPTHGATRFHQLGETPGWVGRHLPTTVIGRRKFYRIG